MVRSACLIFNPVAGQGDPEQELQLIRSFLEPQLQLEICQTTEEVGAKELALQAVERQVEAVIASGGDGTLSAAAAALANTDIPFGVIPRGTANAFAHALCLPDTIEESCQTILAGLTKRIDVATCGKHIFLLSVGLGLEAEMVQGADRTAKDRFGVFAYVLSAIRQLKELQRFTVEMETEDKIIKVGATSITVANASPTTSILAQGPASIISDDGLLDVTIFAPTSVGQAIAASYHLLQSGMRGNPSNRQDIGYFRTKAIRIHADPPQKVVLDGEPFGETPIDIRCIPQALVLMVPEEKAEERLEKLQTLQDVVVIPKR